MGQQEEKSQETDQALDQLSAQALEASRILMDEEVAEIYSRYGLHYDIAGTDEYRLCAIIHAYERMMLER